MYNHSERTAKTPVHMGTHIEHRGPLNRESKAIEVWRSKISGGRQVPGDEDPSRQEGVDQECDEADQQERQVLLVLDEDLQSLALGDPAPGVL